MFWLVFQISKQIQLSNDNHFRSSHTLLSVVSKELGVEKEEVYVNTSADRPMELIIIDNQFISRHGTDPDKYAWKIELYKSGCRTCEVEKIMTFLYMIAIKLV